MFSPWMILLCCDTWQQSFVSHQGCPCTAEVISYGGNVLVVVTPLTSRVGRVNNAQNIFLPFFFVSSFFSIILLRTSEKPQNIVYCSTNSCLVYIYSKSSLLLWMGHSIHGAVVIRRRRHRVWTPCPPPWWWADECEMRWWCWLDECFKSHWLDFSQLDLPYITYIVLDIQMITGSILLANFIGPYLDVM